MCIDLWVVLTTSQVDSKKHSQGDLWPKAQVQKVVAQEGVLPGSQSLEQKIFPTDQIFHLFHVKNLWGNYDQKPLNIIYNSTYIDALL